MKLMVAPLEGCNTTNSHFDIYLIVNGLNNCCSVIKPLKHNKFQELENGAFTNVCHEDCSLAGLELVFTVFPYIAISAYVQ